MFDLASGDQVGKIVPPNPHFEKQVGREVSMEGNRLVIGAWRAIGDGEFATGAAYVFDLPGVLTSPSTGAFTTEHGGTQEIGVQLATPPMQNVTVMVRSSDLTEGSV